MFKEKFFSKKEESEEPKEGTKKENLPKELSELQEKLGDWTVKREFDVFLRKKIPEFLKEMEPLVDTVKSFKELGYEKLDDWKKGPLHSIFEELGKDAYQLSGSTEFISEENKENGGRNIYIVPDFRYTDPTGKSQTWYRKDRKLAYKIFQKGENPEKISEDEFDRIYNNELNKRFGYSDIISSLEAENKEKE